MLRLYACLIDLKYGFYARAFSSFIEYLLFKIIEVFFHQIAYIVENYQKREKCFLTKDEFIKMSKVHIYDLDKEKLVDVETLSIKEKESEKRFLEFLEQIKNPYCYRCGDVGVKIEFDDTMPYLEPKLIEFLIKKKQG